MTHELNKVSARSAHEIGIKFFMNHQYVGQEFGGDKREN